MKTIQLSDIQRCPTQQLDAGHYREDGTCLHADPVWAGAVCQWWALCDHPATGAMPHPVIGNVPICDRCRKKVNEL